MRSRYWIITALGTFALLYFLTPWYLRTRIPQFVLLTFDGTHDVGAWKKSIEFSKNHPARFTYFLSGPYFTTAGEYGIVDSDLGFCATDEEVEAHALTARNALESGNELASHGYNHHFTVDRSRDEWEREFELNQRMLEEKILPKSSQMTFNGFRAPHLTGNEALLETEISHKMLYDSSLPRKEEYFGRWPGKYKDKIVLFPIYGMIDRNGKRKSGMDYSSFEADGERPGDREELKNITLEMYQRYFYEAYHTTRSPFTLLTHFSNLNDGAYLLALYDFAREVCPLSDVECVTASELVAWMDKHPFLYKLARLFWEDRITDEVIREIVERRKGLEHSSGPAA